jgi:hypothetical protein
MGTRGSVVIEALCYKPEGRVFDSRWGNWIFSVYLILPATLGPGAHSAFIRNEYQKQKNDAFGSRVRPAREADNLTAICEPIV